MRFIIKEVRTAAPAADYHEFNELCESARRILELSDVLLTAIPAKTTPQRRAVSHAPKLEHRNASLIQLLSAVCVT
ncbi:MAG TPA: hypothetical protein VF787_08655 [Thermoanaerobaculia bacterium]